MAIPPPEVMPDGGIFSVYVATMASPATRQRALHQHWPLRHLVVDAIAQPAQLRTDFVGVVHVAQLGYQRLREVLEPVQLTRRPASGA
jgi:hypothetical protein